MAPRQSAPWIAIAAATALLIAAGVQLFRGTRNQQELVGWVDHAHEVVGALDALTGAVAEAESSLRGHALSRDPSFLTDFEAALANARARLQQVQRLTADNPSQARQASELEPLLERRIALLERSRDAMAQGSAPAVPREARVLTTQIRAVVATMGSVERVRLAERQASLAGATVQTQRAALAGSLIALLLVAGVVVSLQAEARRRRRAEEELRLENALIEALIACRSSAEAYEVVKELAPRLFPDESGAFCLYRQSRDAVEAQVRWGAMPVMREPPVFEPDECWALRRGQPHVVQHGEAALLCRHALPAAGRSMLCVPLTAHGDVMGVLHLVSPKPIATPVQRRAAVIGEQVSMALANLELRESLRNQSIRDPLTGLFNRRYAEETLPRELSRAAREQAPLSVLMVDVDHFKKVNDTYGHDGGDAVLKKIAAQLQSSLRGSDFVSRLGGEELMVVLPGASAEEGAKKAERLREAIEKLDVTHAGRTIRVTASFGVAATSKHRVSADELQRLADVALYRAKHEGRNRVMVAE